MMLTHIRYPALLILLTGAYVASGQLSLLLAPGQAHATVIWPPAGIALGLLLVLGARVWPAIFLGAFLVHQTTAGSWATSLGIAAGNTLEGLTGAYLITTFAQGPRAFSSTQGVCRFAVLAGLLSAMISATAGVTSLTVGNYASLTDYAAMWMTWWLGDVAGDLLVAPLLILWWTHPRIQWSWKQWLEASCLMLFLCGIGLIVFTGVLPVGIHNSLLVFLIIPGVIWAAFRFTERETAATILLLSAMTVWGTLRGFGPFAKAPEHESLLLLQAFMSVIGLMALTLAAGMAERREAGAAAEQAYRRSKHLVAERTAELAQTNRLLLEEIAERMRVQAKLHEESQALHALFQAAPVAVLSLDPEGRATRWNPAAERILGWPQSEVPGHFPPFASPAQDDELRALRSRVLRGETVLGAELHGRRKDGCPLELSISAAPLRDSTERITGMMAVIVDTTERKRLDEQLRQSQKMEAIGRLASGIVHDFNNLLFIITGYCEMLSRTLEHDDRTRKSILEIREAAVRAVALTGRLLTFSRKQPTQTKVLDLNAVVGGLEGLLRRLLGEDIELTVVLGDSIGRIRADQGQIEQILMNLCTNSRDAMPQGGRLSIETANVTLDERYVHRKPAVTTGHYVMLAVTDTGRGMDKEIQSHIFEPFFTTKGQDVGTGLGLSTVYAIVKQSDGHIFVYSELGHGTTFKLYFPRVEADLDGVEAGALPAPVCGGTETVLLVEDETGVRTLVRDTLRKYGYTVLEARHGIEALVLAQQHTGPLHLLITDVVMPQMSGRDVAEQILRLHPNLKVIYMSGYTEDAVVRYGISQGGVPYLQKPITSYALARKVRELLDATAP